MQPSLSRRAIAARANGAKSRGPKTEEGKRRSSQNAVRHGLLAQAIVLDGESAEHFAELYSQYVRKLRPADEVELGLIGQMVAAAWRLRRIWSIETNLFDTTAGQSTEEDPISRVAAAFSRLAEGNQLRLIDRYESRQHKLYQRSFNALREIRQLAEMSGVPNEPNKVAGEPTREERPHPIMPPQNSPLPNEPNREETTPDPPRPAEPVHTESAPLPNEPNDAGEDPLPHPTGVTVVYLSQVAPAFIHPFDPRPVPQVRCVFR